MIQKQAESNIAEENELEYAVLTEESLRQIERQNLWQLSQHVKCIGTVLFLSLIAWLLMNNLGSVKSLLYGVIAILVPTLLSVILATLLVKKQLSTLPRILIIQSMKIVLVTFLLMYIIKESEALNPYFLVLGIVLGLKLNWIILLVISIRSNGKTFNFEG